MNLIMLLIKFFCAFFGSMAVFWTLIQISEWINVQWFLPKFFEKNGILAWIIIPLIISLLYIIFLKLKKKKST